MESFKKIHNERMVLLNKNGNKDHICFGGNRRVVVSAPHGVNQVRLGKTKYKEIGSLATALYLYKKTNCYFIAKTKNNFDDANFDLVSPYKNDLFEMIKQNNIKYLLDFHGLASKREIDVNFGTHLGQNIKSDEKSFDKLCKVLAENGFKVSVDQPFMAGANTIAGSVQKVFDGLFSLQIEINCAITNNEKNFERYALLLNIFQNWIENFA